MSCRYFFVWLAVTLPIASIGFAADTPSTWLPTTQGAVPMHVDVANERASATLVYRLNEGKSPLILPSHPVLVTHADTSTDVPTDSFSVVSEVKGPLLLITVDVDLADWSSESRFGIYSLLFTHGVQIHSDSGQPTDVAFELPLALPIEYPMSVLHQPANVLVLSRDAPFSLAPTIPLWGLGESSTGVRLSLKEGPAVDHLTATVLGRPVNERGVPATSGEVDIDFSLPETITREKPQTLSVNTNGQLPLGTYSGTILIQGDNIQAVSVPYRIDVKWTPWLIPLIALLGLLIGSALRQGLGKAEQRETLLIEIRLLKKKVIAAQNARYSNAFAAATRALLGEFESTAQAVEEKSIENSVAAATLVTRNNELTAAIEAFEAEQSTLSQSAGDVISAFTRTWSLPTPAAEYLSAAMGAFSDAEYKINAGYLDEGERELSQAVNALYRQTISFGQQWLNGIYEPINSAPDAAVAFPASSLESLNKDAETIAKAESTFGTAGAATRDNTLSALTEIHDARIAATQWMDRLVNASSRSIQGAIKILEKRQKSDRKSIEAARRAVLTLDSVRVGTAVELGQFEQPIDVVQRALRLCSEAIVAQLADKTIADADLAAGNYRAAASKVPLKRKLAHANDQSAEQHQDENDIEKPYHPRHPGTQVISATRFRVPPRWTAMDDDHVRTHQTKRTVYRRVASIAVGAALMFVSYLLFAEHFVGHARDIALVFLWGFSSDITFNTVVQQATTKVLK